MIDAMSGGGNTIMVVEDDDEIRDSLQQVLEDEGFGVVTAANGRHALDALASIEPPSLILLDLMMPEMDGYQFLDARARDANLGSIPVVVVSAFQSRGPLRGAAEFLRKPVDLERLLRVVGKYCARAQ
jgi:CheY-like chemotaxis protein